MLRSYQYVRSWVFGHVRLGSFFQLLHTLGLIVLYLISPSSIVANMVSYKVSIMRVLFSMLVVVLLSGCASGGIGLPGSPLWLMSTTNQERMSYYAERCRSYGFKPLTPDFVRCLNDVEDRIRNGASDAFKGMSATQNKPKQTTCRKFGNTYNCSTL